MKCHYLHFFYKNVIVWVQAQNFFKNPNISIKNFLFLNFSQAKKLFNFPISRSIFHLHQNLYFIYIYFWKYNSLVHQFSPYHYKNKYFYAITQIFSMCAKSRLKCFLINLIFSATFFPSLISYLISFLILVQSQPQLLIKHILIKKRVYYPLKYQK